MRQTGSGDEDAPQHPSADRHGLGSLKTCGATTTDEDALYIAIQPCSTLRGAIHSLR